MRSSLREDGDHAKVYSQVQSQFGATAAAYTGSLVHSDPNALREVVELARPKPGDVAIDIATGAGHTAIALAPYVAHVVAYDLTEEMLAETRRNVDARGLRNVVTRQGMAENLPFPDSNFEIVTVRQAPHHYADVRKAVREMSRVAKAGARVVIVDSTSPEEASLDSQWNYIEKLRDPSHVRNYTPSEWREMITNAGLHIFSEEIRFATENGRPMDFCEWVRRMKTRPEAVEELTQLFRNAPPSLVEALQIQINGDVILFSCPLITIGALRK